jgi:glycosyltransferase involved in cell wall biosynthesis
VLPDVVVTDALAIQAYYRERYGQASAFVPYGCDLPEPAGREALDRLGLSPGGYVLYVSRFEPENNAHAVVRAFAGVPGEARLVMVGSAPYAEAYIDLVKREARADARVLLPGAVYGEGYRQLLAGAAAYVHATEVGGTHPALVEAMGFGRPVVVHDTPENREVAGETALYFDAAEPPTLARALARLLSDGEERERRGGAALRRARERYRWDAVADAYERLLSGEDPC